MTDRETKEIQQRWIEIGMWPAPRNPIMDPMQRRVAIWSAIAFVIAVFYIGLSLVTWMAVSWIGSWASGL